MPPSPAAALNWGFYVRKRSKEQSSLKCSALPAWDLFGEVQELLLTHFPESHPFPTGWRGGSSPSHIAEGSLQILAGAWGACPCMEPLSTHGMGHWSV